MQKSTQLQPCRSNRKCSTLRVNWQRSNNMLACSSSVVADARRFANPRQGFNETIEYVGLGTGFPDQFLLLFDCERAPLKE